MIIIKQIPHAVGYDNSIATDFEEFIDKGAITTLQETIANITPIAMLISLISIAILIFWDNFLMNKYKIFKLIQDVLFPKDI